MPLASRYPIPGCCRLWYSEESKILPAPLLLKKLKQHGETKIPGWSLRWQWPDRHCKKKVVQGFTKVESWFLSAVCQGTAVLWWELPVPAMGVPGCMGSCGGGGTHPPLSTALQLQISVCQSRLSSRTEICWLTSLAPQGQQERSCAQCCVRQKSHWGQTWCKSQTRNSQCDRFETCALCK